MGARLLATLFPNVLTLIVGVATIGLILILLLPLMEFRLKLWLKARSDYKTARGTMHLKLLKRCLINLRLKIKETKNNLENLIAHREELITARQKELKAAATVHLVDLEFTNIPGIGQVLKDRVMRRCFDGTLESLRRAWTVYGIGEERAHAINVWVNQAQRKLPLILEGEFPGKERINKKYEQLEKEINQRIVDIEILLKNMLKLEENSINELTLLEKVKVFTFLKSYKGDVDASNAATNYLLGCFPEWGKIPEWFKTLMENYGRIS